MRNIKVRPVITTTVTMTSANTEYSFSVPVGCRNLTLSLANTAIAWRYAWTTGIVATGGHNVAAGYSAREFETDANLAAATLYFSSSTATQTMVISYMVEEAG